MSDDTHSQAEGHASRAGDSIQAGNVTGQGIAIGRGASVTFINDADIAYEVRGLTNPYLGLAAFTSEQRAKYAGRERQVAEAVEKITAPGEQRFLLFITGASGSGKSSFAQAGVLPALKQHYGTDGSPAKIVLRR